MNKGFVNVKKEDILYKYFKEINKNDLLSVEEEIELLKKIEKGDKNAEDKLIKSNLKFVVSIAKDYQNQGLDLPDLINEGNLGLIKAAKKFDRTKGCRFISYAVFWIRQSIMQSLNDTSRLIRLPSNVVAKINSNKKLDGLNLEYEDLDNIYNNKCLSLNNPINNDGDEFSDFIAEEIEEEFVDDRVKNELSKLLNCLTPRERNIIEFYYGLNTTIEPMTLEAIGEKFGLTKERIRQIKDKSIKKLRFNSSELQDIINE